MQEQEFIDRIKEMRQKAQITSVTLCCAESKFRQYADAGLIDKNSFFKEMREIIEEANPAMNETQKQTLETTLRQLYSFFDVDKNGILDYQEVAAALVILCKGDVAQKLKFALKAFGSTETQQSVTIDFKELRRLFHFIFRLSLETSTEILLDYDLEQLAGIVAKDAFESYGLDLTKGRLEHTQLIRFVNKVSVAEMKQ